MKKRKSQWWLYPLRQRRYLLEKEIKKLREETEAIRSETEAIRRETEAIRSETETIRRETEEIYKETESIRKETEILKRQNKSLALIEEIGLSNILNSATISSIDENGETIKSLDILLLTKNLIQIGCNQEDIPFFLQSLELTKS